MRYSAKEYKIVHQMHGGVIWLSVYSIHNGICMISEPLKSLMLNINEEKGYYEVIKVNYDIEEE